MSNWLLTFENSLNTNEVIAAVKALGVPCGIRIPLYKGTAFADYLRAMRDYEKEKIPFVTEILDSYDSPDMPYWEFKKWCGDAVRLFGKRSLWMEAANEPNGDWAGEKTWDKAFFAINACRKAGVKSFITLHVNPDLEKWVSENMLIPDMVGLSCYEDDVGTIDLAAVVTMLRHYFGQPMFISEFGLDEKVTDIHRITSCIEKFMGYNPPTQLGPWLKVGGYWYGSQQCLAGTPGNAALSAAMKKN